MLTDPGTVRLPARFLFVTFANRVRELSGDLDVRLKGGGRSLDGGQRLMLLRDWRLELETEVEDAENHGIPDEEARRIAQTYGFGFGEGTQWGGFLADSVRVPFADAMLVPVPTGVSTAEAASAADNITDGYRAVGPQLASRPGSPVLVVGGAGSGSIGLYAVALAGALGSERILYVDADRGRRAVAEHYGAETLAEVPERLDHRFPITVDAAGTREGLALALGSLGRDGFCTSSAIAFDPGSIPDFPLLSMYVMSTTFATGRIHARRDAPAVLALLEGGGLDVGPIVTRVVAFEDAAEALLEPHTKLLFTP
jgi:alcohol dehydrogenase